MLAAQSAEGHGDFISLSLQDQRLVFRFDTGSGPAVIRSKQTVRTSRSRADTGVDTRGLNDLHGLQERDADTDSFG